MAKKIGMEGGFGGLNLAGPAPVSGTKISTVEIPQTPDAFRLLLKQHEEQLIQAFKEYIQGAQADGKTPEVEWAFDQTNPVINQVMGWPEGTAEGLFIDDDDVIEFTMGMAEKGFNEAIGNHTGAAEKVSEDMNAKRDGTVCGNCGKTMTNGEYSKGESNCCQYDVISEEEYENYPRKEAGEKTADMYEPKPGEEIVTADWRDTEGLIKSFKQALKKLGISMRQHPQTRGSDMYGFILSKGAQVQAATEEEGSYSAFTQKDNSKEEQERVEKNLRGEKADNEKQAVSVDPEHPEKALGNQAADAAVQAIANAMDENSPHGLSILEGDEFPVIYSAVEKMLKAGFKFTPEEVAFITWPEDENVPGGGDEEQYAAQLAKVPGFKELDAVLNSFYQ